jgi:thiamine pyrophosphate-dependent acetolactate synthase large subunit-like protein
MDVKGLSGAEAFVGLLGKMGIEYIFASPGSEWAPVWEYLAKPCSQRDAIPRYLSSRHEEISLGMASGYAKATGKLPAVMLHTTVGALHATMALRGALHEGVPMVVFTGESIGFGEEQGPDPGAQWLRHLADVGGPARLVEPCVKWSVGVNTPALMPATIQRACQLAMSIPRGPVFVSLPMEYLFATMATNAPAAASLPHCPTADPRGIEELARMLAEAKHPVIIPEELGRTVGAVERLVELAELLGAPVVETRDPGYVNFPRTHPLHGGNDPGPYLKEADLVLLLNALRPWHPLSAGPRGARVAVLGESPLRPELPYWGLSVDLCLAGEPESSLGQLVERLTKRLTGDATRARRAAEWGKRHQQRRQAWEEEALALKNRRPIDTRWIVHELNEVLPSDAIVVDETITHRSHIVSHLDRLKPGAFFSGFCGGLGTGLGTALGVKAAAPARPVIVTIGDGAFSYNPVLAALGLAQEYGMPLLIVMFNNHGYLSQKSGVPRYYPEGWAVKSKTFVGTSITPSPDYAAIARAFDGYGEKVEEPSEVRPALERGLKAVASGQLALIDFWLEAVN